MNSHIYNLQERTECNKVEPKLRLWVINYEITNIAKGAAVVKAKNAQEASNILLEDSQFNAYRNTFKITRIEEIITDGMYANLAMEEWIRFSDVPNLDASKIIYIPSSGMNSRNVQGAIDELNSNIKNINITPGMDLSEYAKKDDVPTKISQLINDTILQVHHGELDIINKVYTVNDMSSPIGWTTINRGTDLPASYPISMLDNEYISVYDHDMYYIIDRTSMKIVEELPNYSDVYATKQYVKSLEDRIAALES